MKQLESNFKNMVGVLLAISLLAALILSWVYGFTKAPIQESNLLKQQNAVKAVLPPFYQLASVERVRIESGDTLQVFNAYAKDGTFVGAAVESVSHNGFSNDVRIMVGFDHEANIVDYIVLEQKETPGLGAKMAEWFKTERNAQNIKGKNPLINNLTVSQDGGEVDAITAATISSRAFLEAVQHAYNAYLTADVRY